MRNVRTHIACIACTLIALIIAAGSGHTAAQGIGINWSPPKNLSNTPTSSNRPTIAVDAAGNVHVVWGEDMGGESLLGIPGALLENANTLVYTRWDGSTWSDPIDIIVVPGDNLAEHASLAVDSQQYLHLVWTGMSTIYYSRAPAAQAGSAHAWLTPIPVGTSARTAWESSIAVDVKDVPHILYATRGDDVGVFHTTITDQGFPMEPPVQLSSSLDWPEETGFLSVSLKIDARGRFHALWGTVGKDGFGRAIYYARSRDGQTWSKAVRLAQGKKGVANAEWPSLGIAGDSELHLIYPYPANMARTERISLDAGETWGEPHTIYPDLEGINGFNVQLTDAAGNLHAISNMRTHEQVGGLIYWRWLGDRWSPWQFANIESEATGPGGHFTAATIRLGNEIHALWNTNFSDQAGEVWHVSGIIPGVPAHTPAAAAAPQAPQQREQPRSSPDTQAAQSQPTVATSSQSISRRVYGVSENSAERAPDAAAALLVGVTPALLLVLGVVAWRLARKRKRSLTP